MDYRRLGWIGDCLSTELYADENCEEFNVGIYRLNDFPDVIVHVATETGVIIDAYVEKEFD